MPGYPRPVGTGTDADKKAAAKTATDQAKANDPAAGDTPDPKKKSSSSGSWVQQATQWLGLELAVVGWSLLGALLILLGLYLIAQNTVVQVGAQAVLKKTGLSSVLGGKK